MIQEFFNIKYIKKKMVDLDHPWTTSFNTWGDLDLDSNPNFTLKSNTETITQKNIRLNKNQRIHFKSFKSCAEQSLPGVVQVNPFFSLYSILKISWTMSPTLPLLYIIWGPHREFRCPTSFKNINLPALLDKMRTFYQIWGPDSKFTGSTSFENVILLFLID